METNGIGFKADYEEETMTFEQVSTLPGNTILEFGAPWCRHCQAAHSAVKEVLTEHAKLTELTHVKIYDGKGKRLGRAFKVKLWPTFIILQNGNELARLVRPSQADEVRELMSNISE
ncbi:thioredoxin family protein [uncultured Psychromonas sp.]|uniref:thioredoxin family protein n=1 Tax=uncultured Psychromonas sp. TaxID=173974 RepID=UPI002622608C|nr:thioredoxin family protein [uncultured Psychromonas sp.]